MVPVAAQGQRTQFAIDLAYGGIFLVGFVALIVFGFDPRIAAFLGGIVAGYFLHVWEKMSTYERVIEEAVSLEVQQQVAPSVEAEVQEQVQPEVEERVGESVEAEVQEQVQPEVEQAVEEQVAPAVEAEVEQAVEEQVVEEVERKVEEELDREEEEEETAA